MGKGRAPCCDKNQVKRGPWSPAEDLRLITFIQKHGHDNWRALPKQAGLLRCGKSCRLRWINYLRPDVKRGNFTEDEEETIIKLHKAWGNKWSKIASRLPGRTDNEIKNVWNTHLKKRLQSSKASDNIVSGDESKESSITSSSSSSSLVSSNGSQDIGAERNGCQPNKNSMAENPHGEVTNNHSQQFSPQPTDDRKEQTSCSVLSFESTSNTSNSSSQADILWPEDPMDSQTLEFEEININTVGEEEEVEKKHQQQQQQKLLELELESSGNIGIEIPFECDIDFWNMLDLDNIELFQPNEADQVTGDQAEGCQGSNFGAAAEGGDDLDNNMWFRYLENELGLDQLPKAGDQEKMVSAEETSLLLTENSVERSFVDSQDLHWSKLKANPEVDPCMAYFQMGPPLSPQQP